jgi:hypothetical protein
MEPELSGRENGRDRGGFYRLGWRVEQTGGRRPVTTWWRFNVFPFGLEGEIEGEGRRWKGKRGVDDS